MSISIIESLTPVAEEYKNYSSVKLLVISGLLNVIFLIITSVDR